MFFLPAFFERNSVIPWYLFLNKCSLETGQLIKPIIFLSLTNFVAASKHLKIYSFDFSEILSKGFFGIYLTSNTGNSAPFKSFILILLSIFFNLILYFNFFFCKFSNCALPIINMGLCLYLFFFFPNFKNNFR